MKDGINAVALGMVILLFLAVTVMGFMAARWRRGAKLDQPRRMGARRPAVRFLDHLVPLGGDIYTAYTFVAVPAAMFATGAAPASSPSRTRSSCIR